MDDAQEYNAGADETESSGLVSDVVPGKQRFVGGMRTWLRLDSGGEAHVLVADKYEQAERLAVPLRDLRILDPSVSTATATALLVRERALVVNLESVRAIITADHVLLLNADETSDFVMELKARLKREGSQAGAPSVSDSAITGDGGVEGEGELPFELRALEVCLEAVCAQLEKAYGELEAATHTALDALTAKVNAVHLERASKVRSRVTRLATRIANVREELEKLLDDDSDMRDMYLTRKAADAIAEADAIREAEAAEAANPTTPAPRMTPRRYSYAPPRTPAARLMRSASMVGNAEDETIVMDPYDDSDLEQVEFLLENYFMLVDATHSKIGTLSEYVDDTVDYVNSMLDTRRNQLIQLQLLLTMITFCLLFKALIVGVFGMNLTPLWAYYRDDIFDQYNGFSVMCILVMVTCFVIYMRRQGMMDLLFEKHAKAADA